MDCHRLNCLSYLFALPFSVCTTQRVLAECRSLREDLDVQIAAGNLKVVYAQEYEHVELTDAPNRLSVPDLSLLRYLQTLPPSTSLLLSNDKLLRKQCRKRGRTVHGLLWLLECFVQTEQMDFAGIVLLSDQWMAINPWAPRQEILRCSNAWEADRYVSGAPF